MYLYMYMYMHMYMYMYVYMYIVPLSSLPPFSSALAHEFINSDGPSFSQKKDPPKSDHL